MKKLISLIRACMTEDMNLLKINTKKQNKMDKLLLPIMIAAVLMFSIGSYAERIITVLSIVHLEYVVISIFVLLTFILTLVEGIYKSSNLLFNCKDDNLLLSMPIKKSIVLFIRVFKFYVFELMYNSLFLLPALVVYAMHVKVGVSYYMVCVIGLFLLPIIPIIISCFIGGIISFSSSKFKKKNIAQIFITTVFLVVVLYLSFNLENIIQNLGDNALNVNTYITKLYYPAKLFINLIIGFNLKDLLLFLIINISVFIITLIALGNIYFKINSRAKMVNSKTKNKNYKIKTSMPIVSLIKKELNRFINSPVFVTNAAFGLVLFLIGCILICVKQDYILSKIAMQGLDFTIDNIKYYMPVILFGFICFSSLMSSITSSMISLEGKSFNILKSLPISPFKVIISKVLIAALIMLPFILSGDILIFIKFKFTFIQVIIILVSSIIMPVVSGIIGIMINLKYPKMNAKTDTEVVKQSISSMISVFLGMILTALTFYGLFKLLNANFSVDLVILIGMIVYSAICAILMVVLKKISVKRFNNINV